MNILQELKLLAQLNFRATGPRLSNMGFSREAVTKAASVGLLRVQHGSVFETVQPWLRKAKLAGAGLTEEVDARAFDGINYVRRVINGQVVLLRVIKNENGKLTVADPATPDKPEEVNYQDVAAVNDDEAEKEMGSKKPAAAPSPMSTSSSNSPL